MEGVEVSAVWVMTDVSNVQVVWETTYVSVASKASSKVVSGPAGVDVEIGRIGGCPSGPSSAPVGGGVPVPVVVQAQALLVHRDCRRSMGALLAATRRLRLKVCTVRGVRWLLRLAGIGASTCHRWWCT